MSSNAALRVTKNAGALLIGKSSVMIFTFLFVVYIARFLGVDGFGKYALLKSYFELFLSLGATGLCIVVTREVARDSQQVGRYLSISLVLTLILVLGIGGLLIGLVYALPYAQDTRTAAYLVSLALLPAAISRLYEAVFVAFEKAELVAYGTLAETVVRTGVSVVALYMGYGLFALFVILVATRVGMLLLYIVFLRRLTPTLTWQFDWGFLGQLFHDWRVFAIENWLSNLFWSLSVIILSALHGEVAVGIYSAAAKITGLFSKIAQSYTTAVFPYLTKLFAESKDRFQQLSEGSLKYMLVLVLPGVVVMATLADELVLRLYTAEYQASIPVLQILVWVVLIRFLAPFLSHVLFARGEQRKSLWVSVISLPVHVVLAYWFTLRWAEIGTAWALLLAASLTLVLFLVFALSKEAAARIMRVSFRIAVAAGGLGVFLWVLRDNPLLLLLTLGGLLYLLLLLLLRVPSLSEFAALGRVARSGLRQLQTIRR